MHAHSKDTLKITKPGVAQYLIACVRVVHGLTAMAPGLFLLLISESSDLKANNYWDDNDPALLLFFGLLSTLVFHAFRIYDDELFSNLLRFRRMLFCWLTAFSMLFFLHWQLGLFDLISEQLGTNRQDRAAAISAGMARYVMQLEELVLQHPYNWFNFYDFWQDESTANH